MLHVQQDTKEALIKRIKSIEHQLHDLQIELAEEETQPPAVVTVKRQLSVGERVTIRNPNGTQPKHGILTKIHRCTWRGTVRAKNDKGKEVLIVRLLSNLKLRDLNDELNN